MTNIPPKVWGLGFGLRLKGFCFFGWWYALLNMGSVEFFRG